MRKSLSITFLTLLLVACDQNLDKEQEWQYEKTIGLDGVNPIGIATDGDLVYLSDGDHNRIMTYNQEGEVVDSIAGFERPMHIDYGATAIKGLHSNLTNPTAGGLLYIPEYGTDSIALLQGKRKHYISLNDSLDAPGGVSVYKNQMAIADFYNNRVLFYNGDQWMSIGKKGSSLGDFNYPTDVQITEDHIYVADAYNNRAQVFEKGGRAVGQIGENENMNAATGIFVSDQEIFLTDFENDRVLVFDLDYNLLQVLEKAVDKPTDMLQVGNQLWITNYRKGEVIIYELNPKPL